MNHHRNERFPDLYIMDKVWAKKRIWREQIKLVELSPFQEAMLEAGLRVKKFSSTLADALKAAGSTNKIKLPAQPPLPVLQSAFEHTSWSATSKHKASALTRLSAASFGRRERPPSLRGRTCLGQSTPWTSGFRSGWRLTCRCIGIKPIHWSLENLDGGTNAKIEFQMCLMKCKSPTPGKHTPRLQRSFLRRQTLLKSSEISWRDVGPLLTTGTRHLRTGSFPSKLRRQ